MKIPRILVAASFAVCVMAVAGVSTAAAAEECIKVGPVGLWNNSTCTEPGGTKEWELFVLLLAEWLDNGVAIAAELLTETTDELVFQDNKVPVVGKTAILCSVVLDGWVGPNSLGYISEVLNLAGEAISNMPLSSGLSLDCAPQTGCESNTTVLIWPIGLPTETEAELMESETLGTFYVVLNGDLGWEVQNCLVLGLPQEDECTASEVAAELTLSGTSSILSYSDAFTELAGLKLATCTQGGSESGVIEGSGTLALSGGGELVTSSDNSVS